MSRSVRIKSQVVTDLCCLCEGSKYTGVWARLRRRLRSRGESPRKRQPPKQASDRKKKMILIALKTASPPSTQEHDFYWIFFESFRNLICLFIRLLKELKSTLFLRSKFFFDIKKLTSKVWFVRYICIYIHMYCIQERMRMCECVCFLRPVKTRFTYGPTIVAIAQGSFAWRQICSRD